VENLAEGGSMGLETGLTGKTALITGASRGIGKATALALAGQGCNVVLSSRKQEALDEVAAEIRAAHPGAAVLPKAAHVGDEDAARACVEAAVGEFGAVDVLVNNAATSPHFGPMVELDAARAAKTVQVNQFAVVLWTQLAWRLSMAERGGSIVNIASVGGLIGLSHRPAYTAAKHGVVGLTKTLARDLAADGIRVNAICPGMIRTPLTEQYFGDGSFERSLATTVPQGRYGEASDVANAALYLASDLGSYVNGTALTVDGGWLAEKSFVAGDAAGSSFMDASDTTG
jgi:NAD(P)-dependent dehydrogenase (short-subunit alcohol dehydrogenase family)